MSTTDPLSAEELRALREKAEKAKRSSKHRWLEPIHLANDGYGDEDAAFIAACDPQTVLRIVAMAEEVERLRAENKEARRLFLGVQNEVSISSGLEDEIRSWLKTTK